MSARQAARRTLGRNADAHVLLPPSSLSLAPTC